MTLSKCSLQGRKNNELLNVVRDIHSRFDRNKKLAVFRVLL